MMRYILLRYKQLIRLLPRILLATLVLALAVSIFGGLVFNSWQNSESHQKFRVALCGTQGDPLIKLGILALETLDQTRLSVQMLTLEEQDARQKLAEGSVDAYVMIPEDFLTRALSGDVQTLRYVTAAGSLGVEAVFQREVTRVISQILLTAQKGSYGGYFAFYENGHSDEALDALNELCLEYVALALDRGNAAPVEVLGVGNGLGLGEYLVCGLAVFLLSLLCLPFAPMLIQTDVAVNRLLKAGGLSPQVQTIGEYGVFFSGLLLLGAAVGLPLTEACGVKVEAWMWIPVVMLTSAVGFFAFSLAREWISGVLMQFLTVCAMCFFSGCLYPDYFLPEAVGQVGQWLPAGICRRYLAACIQGECTGEMIAALGLVWLALVGCSVWIRSSRILGAKEAA